MRSSDACGPASETAGRPGERALSLSRLMLRQAACLGLIVAVVASAGCGRRTVAKVNGSKITQEAFYKRLQRAPVSPTVRFPAPVNQQMATSVMDQMISEQLLLDLAKKEGVAPTQQQLDERKKELNGSLLDRGGQDLSKLLGQSGMTSKDLDERLAPEIAQINIIAKYVKVSDDEVQKAYNESTTLPDARKIESVFYLPEAVQLFGIISNSHDKIVEAQKQLNEGVPFTTVASKYSEDTATKNNRGEIGWVNKPDRLRRALPSVPPEVYQKAFATGVGKTTPPFQAAGQWILLRVQDHRPAHMQPFDHVKGVIRDTMLRQKAASNKQVTDMLRNLRKDAKIEVTLPIYGEFFKKMQQEINKQAAAGTALPGGTVTPQPGAAQ